MNLVPGKLEHKMELTLQVESCILENFHHLGLNNILDMLLIKYISFEQFKIFGMVYCYSSIGAILLPNSNLRYFAVYLFCNISKLFIQSTLQVSFHAQTKK